MDANSILLILVSILAAGVTICCAFFAYKFSQTLIHSHDSK